VAWYAPAMNDNPTILYFHGNAGNAANRESCRPRPGGVPRGLMVDRKEMLARGASCVALAVCSPTDCPNEAFSDPSHRNRYLLRVSGAEPFVCTERSCCALVLSAVSPAPLKGFRSLLWQPASRTKI
jgi:hypothetical protein